MPSWMITRLFGSITVLMVLPWCNPPSTVLMDNTQLVEDGMLDYSLLVSQHKSPLKRYNRRSYRESNVAHQTGTTREQN